MRVAVLSHDDHISAPRRVFLRRVDADELVRRLVAERLSNKVIRMFPPDTVFRVLNPQQRSFHAGPIPALEVPGVRYVPPTSQAGRSITVARWYWEFSEQQLQSMTA